MPNVASFLAGLLGVCALSASSASWAQSRTDDAFVPTVAPPASENDVVAEGPTRMKSGTMVGMGIAVSTVGVAEGVLGAVLMVSDAQNDNGMFDGFGTFIGTMALIDAAIHLGVGIPLIAVGARREPTEPEGDKRGIDSAQISVRGSEVVASFTF